MSEEKRPILVPQFMQNFRCIGSACEECCCADFLIYIDHETYKKYQGIRDVELTPLLDKHIALNCDESHCEGNFAVINMLENAKCPFLNEEMLCRIQQKCGEECLSDTCSIYPRSVNVVDGVLERSVYMSCPEAARTALLNPGKMEFCESVESANVRNIIMNDVNTQNPILKYQPEKYFWELRIFTITVLQNRNYLLSERLIILGMFFKKLQELISSQRINEISSLITSFSEDIEKESSRNTLNSIPVYFHIQIELLKKIAEMRFFTRVKTQRYQECFSEFLKGIQYTEEAKFEELSESYQNAYKEYYEPFMSEREYILENYLVNYVFMNLFPFNGEACLFDSYMMLVLNYALIKMHLIGMAGFHKGLTDELVIKLIYSFSKTVEHNHKYLDEIAAVMRQNGFNTLPYMAVLIKN